MTTAAANSPQRRPLAQVIRWAQSRRQGGRGESPHPKLRVRVTPLATTVVVLLVAAAVVLRLRPDDAADIVAWTSTNVENLATHPVAAMLASAFVVPEGLLPELVLVAVGFTLLENKIGTWRTAAVALTGHVVATLLTEYGAYLLTDSAPDRDDVGISYAMFAVLAALALQLTGRRRLITMIAVAAAVLIPFVLDPEMTTTGHLLAVLIGPATAALLTRTRRRLTADQQPPPAYR